MMVFFKERLVFLAVPKTGTSAFEAAFADKASMILRDPPGMKHTNARGFDRKFRPLFERKSEEKLETLAVIREPVDWLGSWFRYRQRPALKGHRNSTSGLDFAEFIQAYLEPDQPDFARLGSQARFLCDDNGNVLVDHLFAYEALGKLKSFLELRLGSIPALQRVNVSPPADLDLPDKLRDRLREHFRRDIEIHQETLK